LSKKLLYIDLEYKDKTKYYKNFVEKIVFFSGIDLFKNNLIGIAEIYQVK